MGPQAPARAHSALSFTTARKQVLEGTDSVAWERWGPGGAGCSSCPRRGSRTGWGEDPSARKWGMSFKTPPLTKHKRSGCRARDWPGRGVPRCGGIRCTPAWAAGQLQADPGLSTSGNRNPRLNEVRRGRGGLSGALSPAAAGSPFPTHPEYLSPPPPGPRADRQMRKSAADGGNTARRNVCSRTDRS